MPGICVGLTAQVREFCRSVKHRLVFDTMRYHGYANTTYLEKAGCNMAMIQQW